MLGKLVFLRQASTLNTKSPSRSVNLSKSKTLHLINSIYPSTINRSWLAILGANTQKAIFQPTTLEKILEPSLNVTRRALSLAHQRGIRGRIISLNPLLEKCFFSGRWRSQFSDWLAPAFLASDISIFVNNVHINSIEGKTSVRKECPQFYVTGRW